MLTLDYFILEQLVAEIAPRLENAAISKIHQPAADCLVLRLWNGRENLRLLIQIGNTPRLHLTRQEFPNPFQPPRFCQLLRARLNRLQRISLPAADRVVEFDFSGEHGPCRLMCELTGTRSNLFLLDREGLLLDALRKPQAFAGRLLRRGQPYSFPPQPQRRPLADPQLFAPEDQNDGAAFEKWLLGLAPMSKGQAAVLRMAAEAGQPIGVLFDSFRADWRQNHAQPALVDIGGRRQLVAYLPVGVASIATATANLNKFVDDCFCPSAQNQSEFGMRADYRRLVRTQLSRLLKRRKHIATQQQKTADFASRRHQGELLLANLHLVKKGMTQVEVTDWSLDPPQSVTLELQPDLSPQENAERFFKHYKKDKRGVDHVERRQQETEEEVAWLESLLLALDDAQNADDVREIGDELLGAGLLRPQKNQPRKSMGAKREPKVRRAESPEGRRIFWGTNNRSNDYLSASLTERVDLWFHAHNMPGCHLVLKRDGFKGDLPLEEIEYAARIAAGYSRGKNAARVEVIVTEGRHVRRPKGAKPGLVTVDEYRTLLVEPLRIDAAESE